MKTIFCSKCLADAHFMESGHDEQMRRFDLYFCEVCKNYTRDFILTEREVVEPALRTEALSDKPEQLRMFPAARVSD